MGGICVWSVPKGLPAAWLQSNKFVVSILSSIGTPVKVLGLNSNLLFIVKSSHQRIRPTRIEFRYIVGERAHNDDFGDGLGLDFGRKDRSRRSVVQNLALENKFDLCSCTICQFIQKGFSARNVK